MDSQAIALVIAAGGLVLGVARLIISILSYRLDARRNERRSSTSEQQAGGEVDPPDTSQRLEAADA